MEASSFSLRAYPSSKPSSARITPPIGNPRPTRADRFKAKRGALKRKKARQPVKAAGSHSGVTNIRNTSSAHWKRWLAPDNRCLVPFTSFSEYDTVDGKKVPVWFAMDEGRPLLAFAGIWANSTCVRKAKEGELTGDVYGFLTCHPNTEVAKVHPKAMPVILTTAAEHDVWMRALWDEAKALQCPLQNGQLSNWGARGC